MDLTGSLSNDILSLSELQYLDLSNNKGLTGTLPSLIRNFNQLTTLILIGCSFFGPIPDSIGSLQQLVFVALNANSFSGPIRLPLIFDINKLTGSIPDTLGYVQTLEAICFNWNSLNGPVPSNLNNLTSVRELYLLNNNLNGPLPNLTGMNFLNSLLVFDDVWKHICKSRSSVELFIYFLN